MNAGVEAPPICSDFISVRVISCAFYLVSFVLLDLSFESGMGCLRPCWPSVEVD